MNKNNNYFEIIVGTFVLACAIYFFASSFKNANVSKTTGYHLIAKFDNIDGLANGSDVKISGVKVGTVENQSLDSINYRATLKLIIDPSIKLPTDSSAKVASEGLLGSKYLALEPGADDAFLKEGEEIKFTQSSVNFEDLLGKFIFGSKTNEKSNDSPSEEKK